MGEDKCGPAVDTITAEETEACRGAQGPQGQDSLQGWWPPLSRHHRPDQAASPTLVVRLLPGCGVGERRAGRRGTGGTCVGAWPLASSEAAAAALSPARGQRVAGQAERDGREAASGSPRLHRNKGGHCPESGIMARCEVLHGKATLPSTGRALLSEPLLDTADPGAGRLRPWETPTHQQERVRSGGRGRDGAEGARRACSVLGGPAMRLGLRSPVRGGAAPPRPRGRLRGGGSLRGRRKWGRCRLRPVAPHAGASPRQEEPPRPWGRVAPGDPNPTVSWASALRSEEHRREPQTPHLWPRSSHP